MVLPTDLYEVVKDKMPEAFKNAVLEIKLHDLQFLHSVIKTYSSCEGDYSKLAEKIARLDGGYTLVAKYAGLWLRGRVCDAGDVEKAVEEVKKEPKLFLARYIRDVLLWRSSEEERVRLLYRVAAPLLLHAVFGPVPEGVTYITQAKDGAVFYQPEEIEKFTKPQWDLLKAGLQPIAKWLAQRHEDLIEEALRDLAGLNGEEARKQYEETLGDLIKALNWACDEVLNESCEILAKLGIPERNRRMKSSLSAFVAKRLTAVFKSGGGRNCWQRVALIVGHALAGYPKLPKRKRLAKDVVEALGDALKPCAVDAYLTIDDKIPPLSIGVARLMHKRELNILSPLAETKTIDDVRKTAEGLLAKWRRSGINLHEAFYALGLAALAAGGKVNKKTADRLLYAASFAVQEVAHPAAVLPVLAALRPLGKKAPHRYVSLLAAASELRTLGQKTVEYIYVALQKLKNLLTETGHLWPLVEAVRTYSNLMRRRQWHIGGLLKEAVADMCKLYSKVKGRDDTTASGNGLLAQRPSYTTAKVYVLAVALGSDVLVPLVQWHCGLGDLEKEAEAVRSVLDWAADHPEELKKIMENDKDFAEWVRVRDVTEDAKRVIEDLRVRLTYVLARYKLNHAPDAEKLEEVAKEFEKAAEMRIKLEQWGGYLIARSLTLRARVFAAKSWGELLERAEGFWELWEEAKKQLKPTARYLATAALPLGEYLVYLAASGDKRGAEELLKKWLWLLDYDPRASVNARLMLRVLGVGEGARLNEVVDVFESSIWREYRPALLMLAGRLQKDEASNRCKKLPKPEVCVNAVAAATGDQDAIKGLKSEIEWEVPEASLLLDRVDGRTLAEVLAPKYPSAQLAFTLLATVEGRADAVRLHGLWGSAISREPLPRQLSRAVYENCGDLNREECRVALLKLYYYHV